MNDLWKRIGGDQQLANARRKLSLHEFTIIMRHAKEYEREKIVAEIEAMAVEQEESNKRNPEHAAVYEAWRSRPQTLRTAAFVIAKSLPIPSQITEETKNGSD